MLVAMGGCGSSDGGGGTVALTDVGSELAKAQCGRIYKCCDTAERAADTTWGPTEADCVTTMTPVFSGPVMAFQAGIDAGRIVYHGDRAKKCLDNIKALSCDWGINFNRRYVPDCARVFDGTVALAGTCAADEECASGFCSPTTGCTARVGVGEACTSPTACQDGLYCPVSAGDHCVAVGVIGGACEVSISCQNNSCVIPDGATSGTCGPPMMCNGI